MKLFNTINYQREFGKIKIQEDILKTNPNLERHFNEIELIDHHDVKINIYSHACKNFLLIFKDFEFNYYLLEKEKDQFLTPEEYIKRHYLDDIKVLESILYSTKNKDDRKIKQELEISYFPKDFTSVGNDLIYTYNKLQENVINYVFIIDEVNSQYYNKKNYFYSLYKFLTNEVYLVFNELEKSHSAIQQSLEEANLLLHNKFSDFINEVEVFKANKFSDFAINISKSIKHNHKYFLEYINLNKNKFDNSNLIK
ncbi:hypothetical protein, partial [uncultured Chryseobacterium sp.]|uniref:hypothetical protein n=1 Tax=uncultured Chryseobacterium sp. TaxID=259322 RepID=UPI0025E68007